ncbi:hypothetical protein JA1_003491 [Spathaspora sp. JA1]|nr:hypothetical protein JA1_003491 [Spathaspora sp. JA1]
MTTLNGKEPTRKLRSKDKTKNQTNQKSLFNFENINELLYRNKQITLTNEQITPSTPYYDSTEIPNLPSANTVKTNTLLPRRRHVDDPLPDSIYELFHRKMTKEEKVMNNEERSRILSEVDNLQTQLNLLFQYDWIRHLPGICLINDVNDFKELEMKKQLTIEEIQRLLRKHENWRRRLEKLTNDIREYSKEELTEDPDYELTLAQLKSKRSKERLVKYGPVIKLRLINDTYLIIDPLHTPKIITGTIEPEPTPEPVNNSPRKLPNGHFKIKIKHQPVADPDTNPPVSRGRRNQVRLEDITDTSTLDLHPHDTDFVFGTCFENINAHMEGFQLPKRLRPS